MVDFAAGHVTSEQSHPIVAALDAALGGGRDGVRFHPGVEYRHLCVVPARSGPTPSASRRTTSPAKPRAARRARRREAHRVDGRVEAGRRRPPRPRSDSVATQIWLWGQGTAPALPDFADRFGVDGRLSSAVDLVRGLGVLTGIEVVDVPGATAGFDNDYAAQRDAALASLADRDFFLLHVEATDEAGHQGAIDEKVHVARALGRRDHRPARRGAR